MDWATHRGPSTQSEGHKEIPMEKNLHHQEDPQQCLHDQTSAVGVNSKTRLKPCHWTSPHGQHCWAESRTKTELEHLCLVEAGRRFTQASQTPFLQPPLLELFTKVKLSTKAFDQVLDGMFEALQIQTRWQGIYYWHSNDHRTSH